MNLDKVEHTVTTLAMKIGALGRVADTRLMRQASNHQGELDRLTAEVTRAKAEAKAAVESAQVAARQAAEERQRLSEALAAEQARTTALEETIARERATRVDLENNPPTRPAPPSRPPIEPPSYDMVVTERTAAGRPQKVRLTPVKG